MVESLEKTIDVSRIIITKLTANADSERLKIQQELQTGSRITSRCTKTVTWFRSSIQSLNTNFGPLFSKVELLTKGQNIAEFMHVGSNTQEALLEASNNRFAQQFSDVQNLVFNIRRLLPEYRSKFSCDIMSGFETFFPPFRIHSAECTILSTRK